ncbi:pentatricopeptide repeat-containing protein At5g66520 [Lactuca sativa]|nr:pentatricopeptide repeat-containing protein At5g66520 [Lactuca sativa]
MKVKLNIMGFIAMLSHSPSKTIKQKVMSVIHDSKELHIIFQIHAFLLKTSLQSDNFIITKLLRNFSLNSSNNLLYARSLFDEMPCPDTFLWNTMIRAYLNSENPDECLSLFHQLRRQDHHFIDSFSLSLVVQACGRSGFLQNGQTIHTQVLKLGFGNDLFVQTGLTEMYVKFGWIEFARKVFGEMKDPDLVSYNVMLAEYVRIGEISLARQLFDKMSQRDLVSWNIMIHGYASLPHGGKYLVSWSKQSHEALNLFHDMQLANFLPDKITIVSVLSACGDLCALTTGMKVHKYIIQNRIEIDIKLATSLVNMYAKCGDINTALKVFNGIKKKDVFLWSAMIMGFSNHGYGDLALDHFNNMINEGVKPNGVTFIGVLSACSHIGLVDKGWEYFNSMSDVYGLTQEMEHYGCMVDILSRAGHLDKAKDLIMNMPFEPDVVVWRGLLGGCKIHKNVEIGEDVNRKIIALEGYDDGNYVLLSDIYCEGKRWEEAVNVRKKMEEVRIQKSPGMSSIEVDTTPNQDLD